jgi:MerR family redox-sensitive transcriptional activator SoxR
MLNSCTPPLPFAPLCRPSRLAILPDGQGCVSIIRYYAQRALIQSSPTASVKREFLCHKVRRLAVLAAGQRAGLTLESIADVLAELPANRASAQRGWCHMRRNWAMTVPRRIRQLEPLQLPLDRCFGCGCLSLGTCTRFSQATRVPGHDGCEKTMPSLPYPAETRFAVSQGCNRGDRTRFRSLSLIRVKSGLEHVLAGVGNRAR